MKKALIFGTTGQLGLAVADRLLGTEEVAELCRWLLETARNGEGQRHLTAFAQYGYDAFDYNAEDAWLATQ